MGNNKWSLLVTGVRRIREDPGILIDRIRAAHPGVIVQAADARSVYGRDHVIGALLIAIEALERKVMIANKVEAEVLLRLACTDQISEALRRTGLKNGHPGCFIALSKDRVALEKFAQYVAQEFELNDSVLEPTGTKKAKLAKILDIAHGKISDIEFVQFLLERAAILVKD